MHQVDRRIVRKNLCDNVMLSARSASEAIDNCQNSEQIFAHASMNLRGYVINSSEVHPQLGSNKHAQMHKTVRHQMEHRK